MGKVRQWTGATTAADGARDAARTQAAQADKAIEFQRETRDLVRDDLQPFLEAGLAGLDNIGFLTDPQQQYEFLKSNPLFDLGMDNLNKVTMNNAAARGKLGSGGTLSALQDNALMAGLPLIDSQTNNILARIGMGQNAAAGQGAAATGAANSISNLLTQKGNALGAGILGAANAKAQGQSQVFGMLTGAGANAATGAMMGQAGMLGSMGAAQGAGFGGLMALCDRRAKEDIRKVGQLDNGVNVYVFKYKGNPTPQIGVMAQEVEQVNPDAVKEINGLKHVDYSKVA